MNTETLPMRIKSMQEAALVKIQCLGFRWDEDGARWVDPELKEGSEGALLQIGARATPEEILDRIDDQFDTIAELRVLEEKESWDCVLQLLTTEMEVFHCVAKHRDVLSALSELYVRKYYEAKGGPVLPAGARSPTAEEIAAKRRRYAFLLDSLRR